MQIGFRAYNGHMGSAEAILLLIALIVIVMLSFRRGKLGPLIRAIEEFKNQFGGGPRPPSHPLPGNDSKMLNRPRSQS